MTTETLNGAGILNEVKEAYADCWLGYENGRKRRNLNFRASKYVSRDTAKEILQEAIPDGYNEFDANLLDIFPDDVEIGIAREYSACLYVVGGDLPACDEVKASERTKLSDGSTRYFWD